MSSCVASCFTCCRAASCAFATSASSPTDGERNYFHFVSVSSSHLMSQQHQRPSRSGTVPSVAERCTLSSGYPQPNSSSDLRPIPASAQHDSTLPASNHLRVSARTLPLCLASLSERNIALQSRVSQSLTATLDCVTAQGNRNALRATAILIVFRIGSTPYKTHSREGRLPSSRCIRSARTQGLNP